jgi:hypothetical protein
VRAHGGLRPPGDSSVAPNGIPTRPVDDGEPIRLGDGAAAPGETIGDAPDVAGLSPGVASSVAPIGIPTDPTGEPGPTPSGEVMPSGEIVLGLPVPTGEPGPMPSGEVESIVWEQTGPQPNSAAVTVANKSRIIAGSTSLYAYARRANWTKCSCTPGPFLCPDCRDLLGVASIGTVAFEHRVRVKTTGKWVEWLESVDGERRCCRHGC